MRASRFVTSRPPVVPYSGPMEPDEPGEPKEPMPLKIRLQEFLQDYLRPKDQGPLRSFESPMIPFLIPKR